LKSPLSTYRLQVNADFPFAAVRNILEYLRDLGVGTLYFSPVFKARPRSPHGYDVTDPSKFSRDVGDEAEFTALSKAAAEMGMTIMLDIVPNHMAAAEDNPWWHDILEHGSATSAADFFDVDWQAPGANNRIVLPILGQSIQQCINKGEIKLELRGDEVRVVYFTRVLPLDPNSYATIFEIARHFANGGAAEAAQELAGIARSIPTRAATTRETRVNRKEATRQFKAALRDKLANVTGLRGALEAAVIDCSRTEAVLALLDVQAYRLDFWQTGTRQINYRRFFDIADLAGVRIEDRDVFEVTHTLTLELILGGLIEGVRIDHVDGLRDPLAYLTRLREAVGQTYVVVEKILAPREDIRADWPVEGTTGYDFIGMTAGLFAHPDGLDRLTHDYAYRTRLPSFADIVYEKKKFVIEALFAAELAGLTKDLERLSHKLGSPFSEELISAALTEISASLSIYRTYIRDHVSAEDRAAIKQALTAARHRAPHIPDTLFNTLRRILLVEECPEDARRNCVDFIINWQQFTGPVMAKGLEDTAFYTYHRLISLSEVGSHPDAINTSTTQFHETIAHRAEKWPFTMNASSTHDTKRSEDVRSRITVLSEMAPEWQSAMERWSTMNARHKRAVEGVRLPEINEELLIYQTMMGAWPLARPRITAGGSSRMSLTSRLCSHLPMRS
jgi:(1->4)-alpha-D-glucan 1-alpha-D-glucosylmutase